MNGWLLLATLLAGQATGHDGPVGSAPVANTRPAELDGAGVTQKLGTPVPADLPLLDEAGAAVTLRQYFGERPIVLVLAYYKCPMLCTEVLNGLFSTLPKSGLSPEQYEIVIVSFDAREGPELARAKRKYYLEAHERPGLAKHVHFLTGSKESIERLTSTVGFSYKYDAKNDQFAHPGMITLLTPAGNIARYFFGVRFQPRDLRLGLVEASEGKIGTITDQVILYCLYYDPNGGTYAIQIVRIAAAVTVFLMVGGVGWALWRERKRKHLRSAVA